MITAILETAGVKRSTFSSAPKPENSLLRHLHRQGLTLSEIGARVGWSAESVRRFLHEIGIDTTRQTTPVENPTELTAMSTVQRMSVRAIAELVGHSQAVIIRALRAQGVEFPGPKERTVRINERLLRSMFVDGHTFEEIGLAVNAGTWVVVAKELLQD